MQLRLHRVYPLLGLIEVGPRRAGIHRRPPCFALTLRTRWTPSPCARLSRPRTTTGPPSHPDGISRRRAFPPTGLDWPAGEGTAGMVPTFTLEPFDGLGAQLCPCSIATATPQAFTVASRPATSTGRGVPRAVWCGCALLPSPDLPGSSWGLVLRGVLSLVSHVHLPVLLAGPGPSGSAGSSRRCRGCFPPSPRVSRVRLPPASPARCDGPGRWRSMSACHISLGSSAWKRISEQRGAFGAAG